MSSTATWLWPSLVFIATYSTHLLTNIRSYDLSAYNTHISIPLTLLGLSSCLCQGQKVWKCDPRVAKNSLCLFVHVWMRLRGGSRETLHITFSYFFQGIRLNYTQEEIFLRCFVISVLVQCLVSSMSAKIQHTSRFSEVEAFIELNNQILHNNVILSCLCAPV